MKFKGFTLAEVLITLAIIGIVAALTIPSVISNYQQQEFKTGLKKAVSVLNEAIQTNIAQEGETPYENRYLMDYLKQHMSVIKSGGVFDGEAALFPYGGNQFFYTADGMRFEFGAGPSSTGCCYLHETGQDINPAHGSMGYKLDPKNPKPWGDTTSFGWCGSYGLNSNPNNTINKPCIMLVDVNGDRKPNPSGKIDREYWGNGDVKSENAESYSYPKPSSKKVNDLFNILITDEKAIPFGVVAQRAMYSK